MTWLARKSVTFVIALIMMGAMAIHAAPVVQEIVVDHSGMGRMDSEFVLAHTVVQVGDTLNSPLVSRDVKRLLDTGKFSSVDAVLEELEDGVRLTYTVRPKLILAAEPDVIGVSEFSASKVRKWLDLPEGVLVDDQAVGVATRNVLNEYRDEQYADASATWVFKPVDRDAGLVLLVITFAEGSVNYIGNIRVEGNKTLSSAVLRKSLTRPSPLNPIRWFWKKRYERYELDDIEANVRELYMDHGFLDVTVSAAVSEGLNSEKGVATVTVDEGRQYRLGDITLHGITLFPESELKARLLVQSGQVASMSRIQSTARRLQAYYGDRGYLHAAARPNIEPHAEQGTVDLGFSIREGDLVYIRNIIVRGNTRTKDKVVRRELQVYPGDIYNQSRVQRSERRVTNLGFFENVRALPEQTGNPDERDLVFNVTEKRTGQFMLGAGFSSVDNLIGFAELSQGNFDILGWPNFTGDGQKLRLRAQFGSTRKDYELSIIEPWFLNRRLSLGFDIYRRDRNYTDYDVERTGASVSLGKALPGANRINLRYNIEESVISDVTDTNTYYELDSYDFETDTGTDYLFESEQDRIKSTLTVSLLHDTRNNPFVPTRGNKINLFYSVSGGPMGFDTDIYDLGMKSTSYLPLWFGHVINLRTRVEFVETFGDTDDVPLTDRLFLGGGRTLRGFDYRDVGPKVIRESGASYYARSYGGQSLFMANLEYTIPIVSSIRFGAFYDTGNVWADPYDIDLRDLASSAGCGIRLDMPGFPIRVDRAWAIETDDQFTEEDHWVIWIGYDY
jgi:outer membrane protein insertion porin family